MGKIINTELMHEGIETAPPLERDVESLHVEKFSKAASLAELADEYVYFTHGLLFTHGNWFRDPVVDFIIEHGGDVEPFHIQLPYAIFKWFDAKDHEGRVIDDAWNYQICAVQKEHWEALFAFLAQMAGSNEVTRTYHLTAIQKIPIIDSLALAKHEQLPSPVPVVECYALALLGNRRSVYFAPQYSTDGRVPVLIGAADSKAIKIAKAVWAGSNSPAAGILEPTREAAEAMIKAGPNKQAEIKKIIESPQQLGISDNELLRRVGLDQDQIALDFVNRIKQ